MSSSNEDSLGLLYTAFVKANDAQRYALFAKIRNHLVRHPSLREQQDHPLYLEALDWHIGVMNRERETLLDLLENRRDFMQETGFSNAPEEVLHGFDTFNECLMLRLNQLKKIIKEAKLEKSQRESGVWLMMQKEKRAAA